MRTTYFDGASCASSEQKAKTLRNVLVMQAVAGGAAVSLAYAYLRRSVPPGEGTLRLDTLRLRSLFQ